MPVSRAATRLRPPTPGTRPTIRPGARTAPRKSITDIAAPMSPPSPRKRSRPPISSAQPAHAYFSGCSNGGRQALMEVQRYPEDFDGIIAGDPATGTPMQVGRALVSQHLLASPENYLTPEKVELLSKATLDACDATDGLKDGLDHRSAPLHVQTRDVEMLWGRRPELPHGRTSRDGQADLHGGQAAERRRLHRRLPLRARRRRRPGGRPGSPAGRRRRGRPTARCRSARKCRAASA